MFHKIIVNMGINSYSTCSKDFGETKFTLQSDNEDKNPIQSQALNMPTTKLNDIFIKI